MPHPILFGRRIHIAGSVCKDLSMASTETVLQARGFVEGLVTELVRQGACFVIPVDEEKPRDSDGQPACFDWLVWQTLQRKLHTRPAGAPIPLAIAVQHYKNEDQIPTQYTDMWDELRGSDLVQIDNAAQWDMASKRMDMQASHGDILITLGGGEGVLHLANRYHDSGKPVIPLNFKLCPPGTGSLRLFEFGLSSSNSSELFRTDGQTSPHGWINRINFTQRHDIPHKVREVIGLLESLEPPTAFCVRLLNPGADDFNDVEEYFETVLKPVVEGELRYKMIVVDGAQPNEFSRIDQEIFNKLHRSRVVLVDITGARPNCFIELGYALGRPLPTMLLAKEGTDHPFDIKSLSGHHWKQKDSAHSKKEAFRSYWQANINRPPLVPVEPLIR